MQGKRRRHAAARDYQATKAALLPAVLDSFARLAREADLVLVEGAGSPAEINLRAGDIANMGFAAAADVPVVLVGDIDRGGVIASLVGTHACWSRKSARASAASSSTSFAAMSALFDDGLDGDRRGCTGWPSLGVVPWLPQAARLPAEDAVDLDRARAGGDRRRVNRRAAACRASPISTISIRCGWSPASSWCSCEPGEPIPGDADLVILPGSKSTIADLAFLRAQGWDIDIAAHVRRGGHVLGLCGGYQMLGQTIADPDGIEGAPATVEGLGLLDIGPSWRRTNPPRLVTGTHCATGAAIEGYEIHLGRSEAATARGRC